MSCRNSKVVVLWTQEKKVGVEPLASVPEGSRFVGAVTPVKFSGDKKWYPAKVIYISDDEAVLDEKAKEVAAQIASEAEKEARDKNVSKNKSKRKVKKTSSKQGSATEKEIASALGMRAPVPVELQPAKAVALKTRKENMKSHSAAQMNLDKDVSSAIKKNLFPEVMKSNGSTTPPVQSSQDNLSDIECDTSDGGSEHGSVKGMEDNKECCRVSQLVHKHCNPATTNFLKDLTYIFESKGDINNKKYLTLLPIPDKLKKVELFPNKGVYIAASDKDNLKVDFKNKPSSLVRETLFCLYGKNTFRTCTVTARGTKPGSYGIEDHVLRAVCEFTNRNCDPSKHLKFSTMVASINKRAHEWRGKNTPSPLEKKKRLQKSKVVSTSPFKCTPLKNHGPESGGDDDDDDDDGDDDNDKDDYEPKKQTSPISSVLTPRKDLTKRPVSCTPSKRGPVHVSSLPPSRISPSVSQVGQTVTPPNFQWTNPQWSSFQSYHPQGYNSQGFDSQSYAPQSYPPQSYPQSYMPPTWENSSASTSNLNKYADL